MTDYITSLENLRKYGLFLKTVQAEKWNNALTVLGAGYTSQSIYNAIYKDVYTYDLGRSLEYIADHIINGCTNTPEKAREYYKDVDVSSYDFSIASMRKTIAKIRSLPENKHKYPDLVRLADDMEFLPQFIKDLKPFIKSGRVPKVPVPGAPVAFVAPMASFSAVAQAQKFLKEAIAGKETELTAEFQKIFIHKLEGFEPQKVNDIWKLTDGTKKHLSKIVFDLDKSRKDAPPLKPNWKSLIADEAARTAKEIVNGFVHKNTQKLSNIFEKKSGVKTHKVLSTRTNGGILENEMSFTFDDNSSFVIHTKSITKMSPSGKWFYQYPTRFTNVVMADGSKMSMPSEEKMIKEF